MELYEALQSAVVFGVSLTVAVTTFVNLVKQWFGLEGSPVRLLALGLGTLLGSLYLIFIFVPAPAEVLDYVFRVVAALAWSFLSPGFYELLKQTSHSGAEKVAEEVVVPAVLDAQDEIVAEVGK